MKPLKDRFGRRVRDLRISVTDRCDMACRYCMPDSDGPSYAWAPPGEILSFEEIVSIARLFHGMGVRTCRLTGGEPLVRRDLPKLVRMLSAGLPDLELALTTNGLRFGPLAFALRQAGLARVNISLDTFRPERFAELTRRPPADLRKVLEAISAAKEAGLSPVKVNCVVIRGFNEDEIPDFVRFARREAVEVRFIEFMPFAGSGWSPDRLVPAREILARAAGTFPLEESGGDPSEPARRWRFADGRPGGVGLIASVTEPFCRFCDRVRLTADGKIRSCLFAREELDLKALLRGGVPAQAMEEAIRAWIWRKEEGGALRIGRPDFVAPSRPMVAIGG